MRELYRICINTMLLPVFIDRHHRYNTVVVSVGKRLNLYYIRDSFMPLILLLLVSGSVLRRHTSISMFICYFSRNQTSSN
jgi:hypothetical protein